MSLSERPQLINLGYRLLGSLADAEDVVQETYARWYALTPEQRDAIESPGAWMTKVPDQKPVGGTESRQAPAVDGRYSANLKPSASHCARSVRAGSDSEPSHSWRIVITPASPGLSMPSSHQIATYHLPSSSAR
jgi:hypothetical protein